MLEQIKELLVQEPFVPFRILLTSGHAYNVGHPGLVAEGAAQLIYCFPKSDRYAVLRLNQVASIETLNAGKTRARNKGHRH